MCSPLLNGPEYYLSMTISQSSRRPIRSFVIRASRITQRQRQAISQYWSEYGIDLTDDLKDISACFKRAAPTVLEIGFGMGDSLVNLAASRSDINFIGIEVHPPGVGACVASAAEMGLTNLRVIKSDAIEVLTKHAANQSLAQVQILFPDPWHKKKHHKRRLIQPSLLSLLAKKMVSKGGLRIATDWLAACFVSTSMASLLITLKFVSPISAADATQAPTPGGWTSIPIKLISDLEAARLTRESPIPKPISNTVGAARLKQAEISLRSSVKSMPYSDQYCDIA